MNLNNQILCAWSAIVFIVLFLIGFGPFANFIPPTSPQTTAAEVANLYQQHNFALRTGALFTMASCTFIVPFAAVVLIQMKRIGGDTAVLAYTQFGCHILGTLLFFIPTMAWTTVAFRPDRDPNLMLLMNDFGWFSFMMPFMFIFLQAIAVGLAIISDKNARPVFPRYVAYLNFFFALILVPGGLVTYFKSGPFAWDGFVAWWIGGVGFFGWYIVMFIYTLKAIKQQASAA